MPVGTLRPPRKNGLIVEAKSHSKIDANEPNIASKAIEDAPPKGFLSCHSSQLTISRIIEVRPSQEGYANKGEKQVAFALIHKIGSPDTQYDAENSDDIGVDVECTKEARPKQSDGTSEINIDVLFGVATFER